MDKIAEILKATHIDFNEIPFKCELDIPCPGGGCFNCILALIASEQKSMVEALGDAREELCYLRDGFPVNSRVHQAIAKIDTVLMKGEGK